MKTNQQTKPSPCFKCKHHYLTWEKAFPYGCRAMGFKSRQSPWLKVKRETGRECLLFEPKNK
ncbi:hypothetical protein [Desulfatibacillum aliphaticivorans]|uniref:Uracil-DNA glycosylase n=1 Tax=Desulfatibacillum aliphaticivorans TaxID=218208 RepID=B8FK11_DESAL|nr:hypothetical protein [Desulfatibacillum aliphaticivorans]ACL02686.1 hypothetical protein Dalk_0983 [Desulfatibacillum aliphaticivorans]